MKEIKGRRITQPTQIKCKQNFFMKNEVFITNDVSRNIRYIMVWRLNRKIFFNLNSFDILFIIICLSIKTYGRLQLRVVYKQNHQLTKKEIDFKIQIDLCHVNCLSVIVFLINNWPVTLIDCVYVSLIDCVKKVIWTLFCCCYDLYVNIYEKEFSNPVMMLWIPLSLNFL